MSARGRQKWSFWVILGTKMEPHLLNGEGWKTKTYHFVRGMQGLSHDIAIISQILVSPVWVSQKWFKIGPNRENGVREDKDGLKK